MDIKMIRKEFPCFLYGDFPIYLDNAATTQKPVCVLDALSRYYTADCSNIHRGNYQLSRRADDAYCEARESIRRFLNGAQGEVVFTKGVTDAIHAVVFGYCAPRLSAEKNVVVTATEHHSNYLPWQAACTQAGASLRVAPIDQDGRIILAEYEKLLDNNTVITSFPSVANSTGIALPVKQMVLAAHRKGIPVMIDAAQSVAHSTSDVAALDCDFFCFSGHKLYGPTGIGVLWGKKEYLKKMQPYQYGGGMISRLSSAFEQNIYQPIPERFEAGTPPIAGAIGLASAVKFLNHIGLDEISTHERFLTERACALLSSIPNLHIIGHPTDAVLSISIDEVAPYDLGVFLDMKGIAIRCGTHCSIPTMTALGLNGTARISFGIYNTEEEVDILFREISHFSQSYVRRGVKP